MFSGKTTLGWFTIIIVLVLSHSGLAASSTDVSDDLTWLNDPEWVSDGLVSVVVFLENDQVQSGIQKSVMTPDLSRGERIREVSNRLKSYRPVFSEQVSNYLNAHSSSEVIRHWIIPAFSARLTIAQVKEVSGLAGVESVVPDARIEGIEPVEVSKEPPPSGTAPSNLDNLGVRSLWSRGYTGRGRLVCSFDTGVEQAHPALSGNWRGNHSSISAGWMSTITPGSPPTDISGHGTHTMGTMVGVEGTDTIGVAPGAEWITAGVIDQGKTLDGTISDILQAFQWALNPDGNPMTTDDVPDVILNSWGVPSVVPGYGPCGSTFWQAIDNVEAAGIVTIFAAGNEGPNPSTIRNPASRATSPTNSFSVGAVDGSQVIADFSSRGPVYCNSEQVKPEIVAPGVMIRSADKNGGYKYMSGTSMAAPHIAGLVAICREYNPDVTVEEIKWALIRCAIDLGPAGEDNSYGNGLVDASRLLDYLPSTGEPTIAIANQNVDNGNASPDEQYQLSLTLTNEHADVERVAGYLETMESEGVEVVQGTAQFYFGIGGAAAINDVPYTISLGNSLYHGQEIMFRLTLYRDSDIYDTLEFSQIIGHVPHGTQADHSSGRVEFTVSDYGQYGLAPGSIYNVQGSGFRYNGSDNLLYEAGIILGRNDIQLSSSIRGADGSFDESDFEPVQKLAPNSMSADAGSTWRAEMRDSNSEIAIPVTVVQESTDYGVYGDDGFVIMKYLVINSSLEKLNNLYFGFLADFDLPGDLNNISSDQQMNLIYQSGEGSPLVGLTGLSGMSGFKSIANDSSKVGFTPAEKFELISTGTDTSCHTGNDLMIMISGGPYDLAALDTVEVALAFVAGGDEEQLLTQVIRARERYLNPTIVNESTETVPEDYELQQNYPNPFNPVTTISFTLPVSGKVSLEVYNLLGQHVKQLLSEELPAGTHQVEWDGRNSVGDQVATGVYFYNLTCSEFSQSRKMALLR